MRRFLISLIFVLFVCFAGTSEAKKLALLVGVDEYDDVPSLKCCVNDMKTLKEALMKIGFEEDDIQILITGGATRDFPTKKRIERKISEILSSAGPKDLVFLAFSGHGAQEGKTVFFCPPEAEADDLAGTCVSITQVMDDLAQCKAKFKWMVVDACRNDPNQGPKGIGGKSLQIVPAPPEGIALFQSCARGEESWEDKASGNGYFTKNFVAALSGEADANHDGKLTLLEVCTWTTDQTKEQVMTNLNKSQKPYISGSVSDFILTKDLNVPKAQTLAAEAQKAMEAENYALAIEKYDAALALWQFDYWKRERDLAQKLLEKEQALQEAATPKLQSTSRDSFEWEGTVIKKYIGKETEVEIPEGVTEIGMFAFSRCSSLTSVVIPDSVEEIGVGAFAGCTALKEWTISSTHPYFKRDGVGLLTKDGKTLVACLASATEYQIPVGVTVIGNSAFSNCSSLTSVAIPEGVTKIGSNAFVFCSSLTSVEIPEGVMEIGESAFKACSALTSVVIPKSVTKIGNEAFEACSTLTSVAIPEGVVKIGSMTFDSCRSLTSVVIPKGVTEIGINAFYGCSSLTSVVIPEGVTKIGWRAFEDCSSLTSVVIPEGMTEIVDGTFSGCSSLTSVVIPKSVSKIDDAAFRDCPKLTIYAPAGSAAERYAKENNIPFKVKWR